MKYSAEHHDWDMIFSSARALLELGQRQAQNKHHQFSCFTGTMLLSVASLESFMNSLGFGEELCVSWDSYQKLPILDKLKLIGSMVGIQVDLGHEPYQTISQAIGWRNSLMHSKPMRIMEQEIGGMDDVHQLSKSTFKKKYEFHVDEETARRYLQNIGSVIEAFRAAGKNFKQEE